ncbi:MAG: AAA family ATPase [Microbacteriaceae bacterium]|nr:AAA family ATPase [Microbacteriaceae bacterium]
MSGVPPDLVLLKGAPGVGKTTAAKLLAGYLPSGARVEVDTLRQMVISVDWTNQAEHRCLLAISARLAAGFLNAGIAPVIVVDTFSGGKVDGFLSELYAHRPAVRVCAVTLYASEAALRKRILHREPGGFRNATIACRINRESKRHSHAFEHVLDTTAMTPEGVCRAILRLADFPAASPSREASSPKVKGPA